ncbi:hypothetical protein [Streptomyces sp. NPDC002889]|uniref:hypothetical protein n=1 Tax=Streptomyces sp. NPDC002889 TaxID=3364669 RepID=UPI0036B34182
MPTRWPITSGSSPAHWPRSRTPRRRKSWCGVDEAGATHDLLTHLEALNTARRTVRYTVDWKIGEADEQAIAKLPETAWETSLHQYGTLQDGYAVA